MGKKEINKRNRKLTGIALVKYNSRAAAARNSKPAQKTITYNNGIRKTVLEIYHSQGILEAYKALEEYNKKFDSPVYTREMFENWIAEENKHSKGKKIDDGFDR